MIGYSPNSYIFSWTSYVFSEVHVAIASYCELPLDVLEQILSIRKAAFIDRRKWNIHSYRGSEHEFDEYDDDDALYLYTHKGALVTGCVRLRPSCKPTLIGGALSFALNDEQSRPNPMNCWEASRFALLNSETSISNFTEANIDLRTVALFLAMLQFASTQEIDTYEVIIDALMEKVLKRSGWTVDRRNVAQGSKGEKIIYGTLQCTTGIYDSMLKTNHMQRLVEHPLCMTALRTFDYSALRSPCPGHLMTPTN